MKNVPADEVDEQVLHDVIDCLANPSRFAEDWFSDTDINELKGREQRIDTEIKQATKAIDRIINDMVDVGDSKAAKESLKARLQKEETALKDLEYQHLAVRNELNANQNKADQLARFRKEFLESPKSGKKGKYNRRAARNSWKTKVAISEYIHSLPFEEKRRLLSAVIAPENGGKIILRYPTPYDLADEGQVVKDGNRPLKNQGYMIEMRYNLDFDRIGAIISSLNKTDLLNQNGINHFNSPPTQRSRSRSR